MVEHKHVLLHIPIKKSHIVSCLGILGAKSVVASLWVPCVQSNIEAMFHLETDKSLRPIQHRGNVSFRNWQIIWNSRPRPFMRYKFHSFGVRGCRNI